MGDRVMAPGASLAMGSLTRLRGIAPGKGTQAACLCGGNGQEQTNGARGRASPSPCAPEHCGWGWGLDKAWLAHGPDGGVHPTGAPLQTANGVPHKMLRITGPPVRLSHRTSKKKKNCFSDHRFGTE